jgi:hypothetical protein
MKLGTLVDVSNVMIRANFHCLVNNTLRASRGSKGGFAFEIRSTLTPLPCASALASDSLVQRFIAA